MRTLRLALLCVAMAAASPALAEPLTVTLDCGVHGKAMIRSTLFLGTTKPQSARNPAAVSELQWQMFLRDEVTTRFPDGLTVMDGLGQWRGANGVVDQERSKILMLTHRDTQEARQAVQDIAAAYRRAFEQEAVLWEMAPICSALL